MKGRILTADAQQRIKAAIAKKFPFNREKYQPIYRGSSYNFAKLLEVIQSDCDIDIFQHNFSMSRETLQKILLRSEHVYTRNIHALFNIFEVPFDPRNDCTRSTEVEVSRPPLRRIERFELDKTNCNLPRQEYTEFIGRHSELRELLICLSPEYRNYIITVDGIGGVGKTALVIEAAYLCWEAKHLGSIGIAPIYDAIVHTSFKDAFLDAFLAPDPGVRRKQIRKDKLGEIFQSVFDVFRDQSITRSTLDSEEQEEMVKFKLSQQKTLLIIDDLPFTDHEEQNRIMAFLSNLPEGCKAVITTRKRSLGYSIIRLEDLSEEDSIRLIQKEIESKSLSISNSKKISISNEDAKRIFSCIGGIPVALTYIVGLLTKGFSINEILDKGCPTGEEAAYFCFSSSVDYLKDERQNAYKLLLALSIFDAPASKSALSNVAGFDIGNPYKLAQGIIDLDELSLLREENNRYEMHPITREYTIAQVRKSPISEKDMRQRWVEFYISFAQERGGTDWDDWYINYDLIHEEWKNLLSVLFWCAESGRYEDIKNLWGSLNHFSDLYGYWQDRLKWLNWLIKQSKAREDWETYVSALSRKGWTLTMTTEQEGNLEEANRIFAEAWRRREYASLSIQDYLAHNTVVLYTRQKRYDEAERRLEEKEKIVQLIRSSSIEDRLLTRHELNTIRDRAKIYFEQGKNTEAKELYESILGEASRINWKRGFCYVHNMLASIALREGDLGQSEYHLKSGFSIAQINKNKRRIACYERSFAQLARAQGNTAKFEEWAKNASEGFMRLGMVQEAKEVEIWLKS